MKFPDWLSVAGDAGYRGQCPKEGAEHITFFAELRRRWPDTYGRIALHPRNEGIRTHWQAAKEKAEGMAVGAPDVVIPGAPTIMIEIKRRDHTQSKWQPGQLEYMEVAHKAGCRVVVALGYEAAIHAVERWIFDSVLASSTDSDNFSNETPSS